MSDSVNDVYTILEVITTSGNIIEIVNTEKLLSSDIPAAAQIDGGTP